MKKSSLKTWLKGKNRYIGKEASLKGALWLTEVADNVLNEGSFEVGSLWFHVDVLGDGTAISYCYN